MAAAAPTQCLGLELSWPTHSCQGTNFLGWDKTLQPGRDWTISARGCRVYKRKVFSLGWVKHTVVVQRRIGGGAPSRNWGVRPPRRGSVSHRRNSQPYRETLPPSWRKLQLLKQSEDILTNIYKMSSFSGLFPYSASDLLQKREEGKQGLQHPYSTYYY